MKKTAQEIQDDIFRKMSAERKIKLASLYWYVAKIIFGTDKIYSNSKKQLDEINSVMMTTVDQINLYFFEGGQKNKIP